MFWESKIGAKLMDGLGGGAGRELQTLSTVLHSKNSARDVSHACTALKPESLLLERVFSSAELETWNNICVCMQWCLVVVSCTRKKIYAYVMWPRPFTNGQSFGILHFYNWLCPVSQYTWCGSIYIFPYCTTLVLVYRKHQIVGQTNSRQFERTLIIHLLPNFTSPISRRYLRNWRIVFLL